MTQNTRDYTNLEWDYTELASTYSLRPQYSARAVDQIVAAPERSNPRSADIGAGTGHLTLDLSARGCTVDAVEPNEAMRTIGLERTAGLPGVTWFVGIGEETGLESRAYDLVAYGSAFSTVDQPAALREAARILDKGGWFACIWNHRKLDDPLQEEIEELIKARVPGYEYGQRRKDHTPVLEESGLFGPLTKLEEPVLHSVDTDDWLVAWRSHATLQTQAGDQFDAIVDEIEQLVRDRTGSEVEVPYTTVGWLAQLR